jgi:chromosome segregation ATPase
MFGLLTPSAKIPTAAEVEFDIQRVARDIVTGAPQKTIDKQLEQLAAVGVVRDRIDAAIEPIAKRQELLKAAADTQADHHASELKRLMAEQEEERKKVAEKFAHMDARIQHHHAQHSTWTYTRLRAERDLRDSAPQWIDDALAELRQQTRQLDHRREYCTTECRQINNRLTDITNDLQIAKRRLAQASGDSEWQSRNQAVVDRLTDSHATASQALKKARQALAEVEAELAPLRAESERLGALKSQLWALPGDAT